MPTQPVESRSSGLDDAAAETVEDAKFHSYAPAGRRGQVVGGNCRTGWSVRALRLYQLSIDLPGRTG